MYETATIFGRDDFYCSSVVCTRIFVALLSVLLALQSYLYRPIHHVEVLLGTPTKNNNNRLTIYFIEVEDGIEVEDEAEVVEEEAGEGAILEADEVEEEEADDEGTGAPHVDITSYFPEAQVSAGKVSEVLVSVKVRFQSESFRPKFYNFEAFENSDILTDF